MTAPASGSPTAPTPGLRRAGPNPPTANIDGNAAIAGRVTLEVPTWHSSDIPCGSWPKPNGRCHSLRARSVSKAKTVPSAPVRKASDRNPRWLIRKSRSTGPGIGACGGASPPRSILHRCWKSRSLTVSTEIFESARNQNERCASKPFVVQSCAHATQVNPKPALTKANRAAGLILSSLQSWRCCRVAK